MARSPKKGLFVGKSHKEGGIPSVVKETGQLIEIEGDEYYICRSAYHSDKVYNFENKTNKQILDEIYSDTSCKLNQSVMSAGDFIVCKLVVKDSKKYSRSGTIMDIVNEMQGEKACKVENGSPTKRAGGEVQETEYRTIKRKDGTTYQVKVYSEEELQARAAKKQTSLKNLAQNISKLRNKVNQDLQSENQKDFLTALVVYAMLETSERVGNQVSASNGNYGITGWKKSHVTISGNEVNLKYRGKSSVEHEKTVNNVKLATLLKQAIKNSPNDEIFVTSNGFKIKADRVNRYLKKFDISTKDIRGYSANKWLVGRLKRITPEEKDTKRKKQFNRILKEVAQKVGHKAPTLKKHYLLPQVETAWIEKSKVVDLKKIKPEQLKLGGSVKQTPKQKKKVAKVMKEFKDGELETSYGKKVTDHKQAVAIALSEAERMDKKEDGGSVKSSNWFSGELSFLNW